MLRNTHRCRRVGAGMTLDDALTTDPALLDAQWTHLQGWLAPRFGAEAVGMEAILFLVGVQVSGEGYRKLEKEAKQDTIMNGTYAVFALELMRLLRLPEHYYSRNVMTCSGGAPR